MTAKAFERLHLLIKSLRENAIVLCNSIYSQYNDILLNFTLQIRIGDFTQLFSNHHFYCIGYGRVILALISFYYMTTHYVVAAWCYIISALLDAIDGHAARYFNQGTKFGAMLDQLTDRAGTMGLLVALAQFYPEYSFWFQVSMAIDIVCHWIYLHSSILQGKTSHKFIDMSENPIMSIYYTNRKVLFFMCAGNEAFYSALYLLHFTEGPVFVGISLFRAVVYLSAPVAFVKTLLSLLHGYVACINLGIIDVKEREALRKAK